MTAGEGLPIQQWCEADDCPVGVCNGPHVSHVCADGTTVTRHVNDTSPCPVCGAVPGGPTDREVIAVIAEHMMNLLQALCATGVIDGPKALQLSSRALVELDTIAGAENGRDRCMSPLHDLALASLDRLRDALSGMQVQSIDRLDGYTLADQFDQALTTMRALVEQHWEMARTGGQPAPKLIIPGGAGW